MIKSNFLPGQDFKNKVKHWLRCTDSPVIIQDFGLDEKVYSSFIHDISTGVFKNNLTDSNAIFDVKVTINQSDFFSFATSNFEFPPHTDCSDEAICPNAMALLCIQPAETGGETTITPLSAVLNTMEERLKHKLLTHHFKFRNIFKTIVEDTNEAYRIRYSRMMIESYSEPLTSFETDILDELDEIVKKNSYTISLKAGNLFLLRNDRFLHGRLAFPLSSERLMKRIRFYV